MLSSVKRRATCEVEKIFAENLQNAQTNRETKQQQKKGEKEKEEEEMEKRNTFEMEFVCVNDVQLLDTLWA